MGLDHPIMVFCGTVISVMTVGSKKAKLEMALIG
jgi:hypothetical protein